MKASKILILALLFGMKSAWAGTECVSLKRQLKSMQRAQDQIISTLLQNHELFASSLEEYSALAKTSPNGGSVMSSQMLETAKAFRLRGLQGKKIATGLNEATGDLLDRVIACLRN